MPLGRFPTEKQLRKDLNLPAEAAFLGWGVHLPVSDEFIAAQSGNSDMLMSVISSTPGLAKRFRNPAAAGAVAGQQERPAVVVAIFDRGGDYAVIEICGNRFSRFAQA